jgi:hypothetical protein
MDSVQTQHRKTITVDPNAWQKYCEVKSIHLRTMGLPELTFTEFANLSVMVASVTQHDIMQYRKKRREASESGH